VPLNAAAKPYYAAQRERALRSRPQYRYPCMLDDGRFLRRYTFPGPARCRCARKNRHPKKGAGRFLP